MNANGTIYEVTNELDFLASYVQDPAQPDRAAYRPIPGALIHIGSALPVPLQSFFPSYSVKTMANESGNFELDCSHLPDAFPVYLVAYQKLTDIELFGMRIPIYGPIYRSAHFPLVNIDANQRMIYVMKRELTNEQGISQEQIDEQIKQLKNEFEDVDSISAFINKDGVGVVGKGRGATIRFRIILYGSTSPFLGEYLWYKIDDFDVDLPGWDAIAGLCVDERKIEKAIHNGLFSIMGSVNKQIGEGIIDAVAERTGLARWMVENQFNDNFSLTVSKVRYPAVRTVDLKILQISFRVITPDLCLGCPRQLYP